ncbi:MAG: hypothetical protein ACK5NL_04570 [Vibrio fluvialis]
MMRLGQRQKAVLLFLYYLALSSEGAPASVVTLREGVVAQFESLTVSNNFLMLLHSLERLDVVVHVEGIDIDDPCWQLTRKGYDFVEKLCFALQHPKRRYTPEGWSSRMDPRASRNPLLEFVRQHIINTERR